MTKNYYELLGVQPGVSLTEIKRGYRKLARKYHPDSGTPESSHELFHIITNAYETLSDPEKREVYDRLHGFAQQSDQEKTRDASREERTRRQSEGTKTYRKSAPSNGQFGKMDDRLHGTKESAPSSARFGHPSANDKSAGALQKSASIFSKLKGFVRTSSVDSAASSRSNRHTAKPSQRDTPTDDLRGPREYYFTIDALESIRGTAREIALKNDDGTPRVIRVKIPAGIKPGSSLKVPFSETDFARVHVHVVAHPIVSRENDDVTIRVPITLLEALNGADIEVPSPQGAVKVRIPPKSAEDKKLRVKGRGIKSSTANQVGDLYVETYIVLPTTLSEVGKQAAQALEAHYNTDIRKDLPREL